MKKVGEESGSEIQGAVNQIGTAQSLGQEVFSIGHKAVNEDSQIVPKFSTRMNKVHI